MLRTKALEDKHAFCGLNIRRQLSGIRIISKRLGLKSEGKDGEG